MNQVLPTVLAIVTIVAVFVGLAVLILWMRDRGGIAGGIVKRSLGAVSLLIGLAIAGWFAYNLFFPTLEFTSQFRRVGQLAFPIALIWFGYRSLFDPGKGIDEVEIDFDSVELRAAKQKARATLPEFIDEVKRHIDGAFIKFPMETDQGVTEHIWGYVQHYENGAFDVSLANTPYTQKGVLESRHDVPEVEVEDWQIMSADGTIRGGFSLVAAFEYHQNRGRKLTKTMRKQRQLLLDARTGDELRRARGSDR